MTVYVLHLDPSYRHAGHYVGWTQDSDPTRRIEEHLQGEDRASPLIRAALAAGANVVVAHVFQDANRGFERNLKSRKDVRRWCRCCGVHQRPLPDPVRMSRRFIAAKGSAPAHAVIPEPEVEDVW